jgi:ABC-type amino acid transport substrate-binding protein
MDRLLLGLLLAVLLVPAANPSAAQAEGVLRVPQRDAAPTRILVLGTPHLAALGEEFRPALLDTLLDTLAGFAPELIAVEALPPEEIDRLWRRMRAGDQHAGEIVRHFAGSALEQGQRAQALLGLDAIAAAERLLAFAPAPDETAQRRVERLLLELASWNVPAALVTAVSLPLLDSPEVSGLDADLAAFLAMRLGSANETVSVGVRLAHRLGLTSVFSMDDHLDDEIGLATGLYTRLMTSLDSHPEYLALMASDWMAKSEVGLAQAATTGDLLQHYLELNSVEWQAADVAAQWHLFYRTALDSRDDRARAALWEARNLRMAANIQRAVASAHGARLLVIAGAAHKPFLEAYLEAMMDVELVQLEELVNDVSESPITPHATAPSK